MIILDETGSKGWIYLELYDANPEYGLKAKVHGKGFIALEKNYPNFKTAIAESRKLVSQLLGEIN